jgi:hypothetical protein
MVHPEPPTPSTRAKDRAKTALESSNEKLVEDTFFEGENGSTPEAVRSAFVMAHFAALLVKLAEDHRKIHRSIRCMTTWLVVLTVILAVITLLLGYEAYLKIQKH